MADNLDHDKMYTGSAGDSDGDYELAPIEVDPVRPAPSRAMSTDDEDDDAELELEPVDAEILAAEKRRAAETVEAATKTIDINEIYRDTEPRRDLELSKDLVDRFRFQFQLKHLLIATAGVAILLTLYQLQMLGTALVITFMLTAFGATAYFQWQEKKRQQAADRRRQQLYAARRAYFNQQSGKTKAAGDGSAAGGDESESPFDDRIEVPKPTVVRQPLRFRFSLGQLLIATACAAILLAIVIKVGSVQHAAILFGMMALVGIVVHALGYDPPEVVAFTWWLLLVLYVVLSISSAIWAGITGP